jgi:hypothetical protein
MEDAYFWRDFYKTVKIYGIPANIFISGFFPQKRICELYQVKAAGLLLSCSDLKNAIVTLVKDKGRNVKAKPG